MDQAGEGPPPSWHAGHLGVWGSASHQGPGAPEAGTPGPGAAVFVAGVCSHPQPAPAFSRGL